MRAAPTWLAIAVLVVIGCKDDRDPPPQQASTGSSTGSDGNGSTFVAPPDMAAAESTGPGWPLPTDDDLLTCVRSCEGPWDCCPPNSAGVCPGPGYPYNYMCIQEMCVFPPCTADSDCPNAGERCLEVAGWPTCVLPCDGDEPCMAVASDQSCSATADDGSSYCFAHCSNPSVFCGAGSCDEASGKCVCTSDGQCQASWVCV
ncbi:MAG: hypothetical protein H6712_05425 [Myxococcales bacterium]|nr:hypothetical protein [Myxococcales bacterium]MCB9713274.1 hypothetical protein [Myxococcales bacterium]